MERAELLHQLKQPRLIVDLVAGSIAVLGLFGCFNESQLVKRFSLSTLMAGVGVLAANIAIANLYADAAADAVERSLLQAVSERNSAQQRAEALSLKVNQWEGFWLKQSQDIDALKVQLSQEKAVLAQALERSRQESAQAQHQAHQYQAHLTGLQQRIEVLTHQLNHERQQFYEVLVQFTANAKLTLSEVVNQWSESLHEAIAHTLRKRPDLSDRMLQIQQEVKSVASSYQQQILALAPSANSLQGSPFIDEILSLLHHAVSEFSSLKVRYRNALNVGDKALHQEQIEGYKAQISTLQQTVERLQVETIPRSQHEAILSEFQLKKDEALDALAQQAEALESELTTETDQYVQKLIAQLEHSTREIANLKEQITQLRKPHNFSPATRDDLRMGNQIIEYFWLHGITLDRAGSDYKKHEATLSFHTDRNPRLVLPGELNEHAEKLPQVLRCLNKPKFEYDSESGLMSVKLALSRKPPMSVEDASRLWKSKAQFERLAAQWIRVRVTGGSEAGKSPTAENIAVCLLKSRPGQVKLSNPQYHSRKNYWSIPVTWTSHKESVEGMKELAERVERRSSGLEGFEEFVLYMFDEIDSTFVKHKSASNFVLSSIKQASHQNLGMIFIGQNANASEYPGMDRSDFENCVNVHIGGNAKHAIVNSNMSMELKSELQSQYDKLMEFCEAKNAELSLDSSNPQAYRFALVIEPQKKPYFIELPHFGCYTFDQIADVDTLTSANAAMAVRDAAIAVNDAANADSAVAATLPANDYVGVGCPKCDSGILGRVKTSRGNKYYVCDSCGKSTSEKLLSDQLTSNN